MKPFIKWAGGKTQLLKVLRVLMPQSYNTYYEPFLGGGALLFDVLPEVAYVNDINKDLINTYNQVKYNPLSVSNFVTGLDAIHASHADPKEFYNKIREQYNKNIGVASAEQAAKFIYLNKHCFNGLYRVNSKGEFNVPFNGRTTGFSCLPSQLEECSTAIRRYTFTSQDFVEACHTAVAGDFVFFDSPYAPLTPTSFTDYTKEGFSYEDHERLAKLFKELTARGVYCMLTNHNTELIRNLYKDFKYVVVPVSRSINSDADNRSGEEVIIINYDVESFDTVKRTYDAIIEARKEKSVAKVEVIAEVTAEATEPAVADVKPAASTPKKKTTRKKKVAPPVEYEVEAEQIAETVPVAYETTVVDNIADEVSAPADQAEQEVSVSEDVDVATSTPSC